MTRTFRYNPDGTSYEVTRQARAPAVHFIHTREAIGPDGKAIPAPQLRELNRQGKAHHVNEIPHMAQDAHNEKMRQAKLDKARRRHTIGQVVREYV